MRRGFSPGFEPVVQSLRFRKRLYPQLLGQNPAAGYLLGQGRTLLSAAGQQGHQLPVRFFLPRLQGQQLIGVLYTGGYTRPGRHKPLTGTARPGWPSAANAPASSRPTLQSPTPSAPTSLPENLLDTAQPLHVRVAAFPRRYHPPPKQTQTPPHPASRGYHG